MLILCILVVLLALWILKGFFFGGVESNFAGMSVSSTSTLVSFICSIETASFGNVFDIICGLSLLLSLIYLVWVIKVDNLYGNKKKKFSPFKLIVDFLLKTFFLIRAIPEVLEEVYWKER